MKLYKKCVGFAAMSTVLGCSPATTVSPLPDPDLPTELSQQYKDAFDLRPEQTAKQFLKAYDRLAVKGFVTRETVLDTLRFNVSFSRGQTLSYILAMDLNGDGKITREEHDKVVNLPLWTNRTLTGKNLFSADENKDDALSMKETLLYSREIETTQRNRRSKTADSYLMLFDLNQDGRVERAEMLESLDGFYVAPKNAKLPKMVPGGKDITAPLSTPKYAKNKPQLTKNCSLPERLNDAQIITISGYDSNLPASVAVGGQDRAAYVAHLTIEEGTEPLYIIVTSYHAFVWVIDGDVSRVKNFVAQPGLSSDGAGVGVVGLPKQHVAFIDKKCLPRYSKVESKEGLLLKGKIKAQLGQTPSVLAGDYALKHYALPSGENLVSGGNRRGRDGNWWTHAKYSYDGYAVNIPLRDVVTPSPVKAFDVLPSKAGLRKLISEGKIVKLGKAYHIVKPIPRFPSRLGGANSVDFILGTGVPMPAGSLGHSKVYLEDTGELIKGR